MSKLRNDAVAQIDCLWNYYKAERALADDLADALASVMTSDTFDAAEASLARYREARQQ